MTASLAQTPVSALLASVALFSLPSAAQPEPAPTSQTEREIAITGATDEPPAVVYGAPNLPLMLSFDAPLRKDAAVTVQGADVRPHAFLPDALIVTPSKSLAGQSSVPISVPLANGTVDLTLAFSPTRRDASVRIVRRASSPRPAVTDGELVELLAFVARMTLESGACANADTTDVPRRVEQNTRTRSTKFVSLVCDGGAFAYMHVTAPKGCAPAAARLTRGEESADILLLRQTTITSREETCWWIVARAPHGDGLGFELDLLAKDGVPCQSFPVDLKPSSP